ELDKAYGRYEAVKRHALRQVDSAREELRTVRERLRQQEGGRSTREMVFKSQIDNLRIALAKAVGKLEDRGEDLTDFSEAELLLSIDASPVRLESGSGPQTPTDDFDPFAKSSSS